MKTLPQYYVIKKDDNNPLWKKYIGWLNETYNCSLFGNMFAYYGHDGSTFSNGINAMQHLFSFQNNPELITLEQWDEAVNGEKHDFILKDCIKCGLAFCMCKHYKQETMEQRKIIGYKAPFDLFNGKINKGDIYTFGVLSSVYFPPSQGNHLYTLPPEIVETWEPVYEEEKLEIDKWLEGDKDNHPYITFKGKLTQEIIDKIKEVINEK